MNSFTIGFVAGIGVTVAIDTASRLWQRWRRARKAREKAAGPRFAVGTKQKVERPPRRGN